MARESVTTHEPARVVLYRPSSNAVLEERLSGLVACFGIAVATGRRLLVDDRTLTASFDSPQHLPWGAPEIRRVARGTSRVGLGDGPLPAGLEREDWNRLFPQDVLEVTDGRTLADSLRQNGVYAATWEAWGMDPANPAQWLGRLAERALACPRAVRTRHGSDLATAVTSWTRASSSPLLSVITVSYNSLPGLLQTHASLPLDPELEYLLLDGGSTDGTTEFIRNENRKYQIAVQEPDRGIFDAMNKGIRRAHGDYILFINCGDRFVAGLDWSTIKARLRANQAVFVGGLLLDDGGRVVMDDSLLRPSTLVRYSLPHQAAFIPRRFFHQYGDYDASFRFSADQEWFFRALQARAPFRALEGPVAHYQGGGLSAQEANAERIARDRHRFLKAGYRRRLVWVLLIDWFKNDVWQWARSLKKQWLDQGRSN